jgi:hypothetical protein
MVNTRAAEEQAWKPSQNSKLIYHI